MDEKIMQMIQAAYPAAFTLVRKYEGHPNFKVHYLELGEDRDYEISDSMEDKTVKIVNAYKPLLNSDLSPAGKYIISDCMCADIKNAIQSRYIYDRFLKVRVTNNNGTDDQAVELYVIYRPSIANFTDTYQLFFRDYLSDVDNDLRISETIKRWMNRYEYYRLCDLANQNKQFTDDQIENFVIAASKLGVLPMVGVRSHMRVIEAIKNDQSLARAASVSVKDVYIDDLNVINSAGFIIVDKSNSTLWNVMQAISPKGWENKNAFENLNESINFSNITEFLANDMQVFITEASYRTEECIDENDDETVVLVDCNADITRILHIIDDLNDVRKSVDFWNTLEQMVRGAVCPNNPKGKFYQSVNDFIIDVKINQDDS